MLWTLKSRHVSIVVNEDKYGIQKFCQLAKLIKFPEMFLSRLSGICTSLEHLVFWLFDFFSPHLNTNIWTCSSFHLANRLVTLVWMLLSFCLYSGRFISPKCCYLTFWEWDSTISSFLVCLGTVWTNPADSTLKFNCLYIISVTWGSVSFAQKWLLEMSLRGKLLTLIFRVHFRTCTLLRFLKKLNPYF